MPAFFVRGYDGAIDTHTTLTIYHATDPHLYADAAGELRGVNTQTSFAAVLAHMRNDRWPPDALILTGDLAQDEAAATYRRLRDQVQDLGVSVLCVPGNHDDPSLMHRYLDAAPISCDFTRRFGAWRFVLLSTHVAGDTAGRVDGIQLKALDALLSTNESAHVALWLHHPPLPVGCAWLDRIGLRNADELLECVRGTRVRAVFCGHVHQQFDVHRDGILFATTPSTCAQFLPQSDEYAVDTRPPGYRRIRFDNDGGIATEVVWVG